MQFPRIEIDHPTISVVRQLGCVRCLAHYLNTPTTLTMATDAAQTLRKPVGDVLRDLYWQLHRKHVHEHEPIATSSPESV